MSDTKKILVIFYSQSGQLKTILENFVKPFTEQGHEIDQLEIKPTNPYKFPWTSRRFFDAMPESVLGIGCEIQEPVFKFKQYDLVIIGYQPWFLSPSIPALSILKHPKFAEIARNTPLVSIIGARNMWLNAHVRFKEHLGKIGVKYVGNIVFRDRNPNLLSAISIQYWMFSGKKEKFLGMFPKPGISNEDIASAETTGNTVLKHLNHNSLHQLQQDLIRIRAIEVNSTLMFIESRASKLFKVWANFIFGKKNRTFRLKLFKIYLIIALFVISPFVILVYHILIKPFTLKRIRSRMEQHLSVQLN
ncbi:MAG: hypothetical protein H6605_04810 [Flavobacteriales bacterium]|nr:hypothetical protein [Flavobacteriales bacterium]